MYIDYKEELNDAQLQAVQYLDGPQLVIAGAGSGKTRVLTYKIAYLLEQGYEPWSILALTFTNKAAKEMKERIALRVGERTASYLWAGTFHSIFAKILRREAHLLGYDANFTIYDQSDSRSLVKSIIKEMQLDEKTYKPAVVAERISSAKSRLVLAGDYARDVALLADDQRARIPSTAQIYSRYSARCMQANAMDFDDLLVNIYRLFSQFPDVLRKYVEQFRYVLVDEFQDTNYVQGCIVWLLTEARRSVCVVGDDAQSIYSFRGANIGNILGFTNRYSDARIFKLEQNYRSTKTIVNAANSLIEKNAEQIQKNVYSERGDGDRLLLCNAYSDFEEGEIVCNKIIECRRRHSLDYSAFAILYRTNSQSRIFEEALRKRSIPYKIYGGLSFYQRKEIKDVIAYFRLISNRSDEEALRRIINYPARGIGDTTLQKIKDAAIAQEVSLWSVLADPEAAGVAFNKGTLTKLAAFVALIEGMAKTAVEEDALAAAREILRSSGITKEIYGDNTVEGKSRQENIEELVNGVADFVDVRMQEGNENNKLTDFLAEVSLLSEQESGTAEDERDFVTLMTVHSAKGLEFDTVFIVGLEEELFPNAMAQNSMRELEEERRLMYVAITRAMERCVLTFAKSRYRYGSFTFCEPSRFLKEIDRRYIAMQGEAAQQTVRSAVGGGMFAASNSRFQQQRSEAPSRSQYSERREVPETPRPLKRSNFDIPSSVTHREYTPASSRLQRVSDVSRGQSFSSAAAVQGLAVGAVVQHERFGRGEVLSMEGVADNAKATVRFDNVGVKTLLLKFAKLKVI